MLSNGFKHTSCLPLDDQTDSPAPNPLHWLSQCCCSNVHLYYDVIVTSLLMWCTCMCVIRWTPTMAVKFLTRTAGWRIPTVKKLRWSPHDSSCERACELWICIPEIWLFMCDVFVSVRRLWTLRISWPCRSWSSVRSETSLRTVWLNSMTTPNTAAPSNAGTGETLIITNEMSV